MKSLLFSLVAVLTFLAGTAGAVTLSLPQEQLVDPGETTVVAVSIDDATGLLSYRVSVLFDETKFSYVGGSAQNGSLTSGFAAPTANNSVAGRLIFTAASAVAAPSGSGTILQFSLAAAPDAEPGLSPITFIAPLDTGFTRLNDGLISTELTDGSFKVTIGPDCSMSIDPIERIHPAAADTGSITVTATEDCEWQATTSDSWINLIDANGTGDGVVNYALEESLVPTRTGTITVGSEVFTVTQDATVLAVELSDFRIEFAEVGQPVVLAWKTAWEADSVGFHVWRSKAGGEREKITTALIPSAGNSTTTSSYFFEDSEPLGSEVRDYYLEEIDIEGKSTFYGPVSTQPSSQRSAVSDWTLY